MCLQISQLQRSNLEKTMKPAALRVYNAVYVWMTHLNMDPDSQNKISEMLSVLRACGLDAAASRAAYHAQNALIMSQMDPLHP